jgi:crotonobetainyl-CoA:carnitine CoA-transferase CaiB-like acyl-CoA transferase
VIATEEHWDRLSAAMDAGSLALDARFSTPASRAANDAALATALAAMFRESPAGEWFEKLDAAGVPCEICDPQFALNLHDDPEMKARGWVVSHQHPFVGRLDQVGVPFDFSETPARVQGPPLIVGQHSRELLAELGYVAAEIDQLCADCVLEWRPGEGHRRVRSPWEAAQPAATTATTE